MAKYDTLLGKTHKNLTCVERINEDTFLWSCNCGNSIEIKGYKYHDRNSCGCVDKEKRRIRGLNKRSYDTVTYSTYYTSYISNCKARKFKPLNKKDWLKLVVQECAYCGGIDTRNGATMKSYKRNNGVTLSPEVIKKYEKKINGVDMVDPSKKDYNNNSVSCCAMCNMMKNNNSVDEFLNHIKKIAKHNA